MKKIAIAVICCLMFCYAGFAQKILLNITGVTAPGGEDIKAVDFKTDLNISFSGGGGGTVSKPLVGPFLIKKDYNTSTNPLQLKLLQGAKIPQVDIEYYDATGAVVNFRVRLIDCYVTNFYWLSPECPTCLKLEHQVAFTPTKVELYDIATGVTVKYNVATNATY
ncbi:hypothetical protein BH11BAC3_BH11BAC3_06280 [soil metagenome]